MEEARKNDPKMYKKISRALNPRNTDQPLAIQTQDNTITKGNKVMKLIRNHWKNQFKKSQYTNDLKDHTTPPPPCQSKATNLRKLIKIKEIKDALKNIANSKAPGPDDIKNELFKIMDDKNLTSLC